MASTVRISITWNLSENETQCREALSSQTFEALNEMFGLKACRWLSASEAEVEYAEVGKALKKFVEKGSRIKTDGLVKMCAENCECIENCEEIRIDCC